MPVRFRSDRRWSGPKDQEPSKDKTKTKQRQNKDKDNDKDNDKTKTKKSQNKPRQDKTPTHTNSNVAETKVVPLLHTNPESSNELIPIRQLTSVHALKNNLRAKKQDTTKDRTKKERERPTSQSTTTPTRQEHDCNQDND